MPHFTTFYRHFPIVAGLTVSIGGAESGQQPDRRYRSVCALMCCVLRVVMGIFNGHNVDLVHRIVWVDPDDYYTIYVASFIVILTSTHYTVHYNSLLFYSGFIPDSIANLQSLQFLDLSGNQLSGRFSVV